MHLGARQWLSQQTDGNSTKRSWAFERKHIMEPRPYQSSFITAVENGWQQFKKQLGVAPTGSGKTIIFSWLAKRQFDRDKGRTLILAHREELIDQAIAKLHSATGIFAEKEKAESYASRNSPVVVASVQTMQRRADKWPQDHFKLVVVDECHHAIADSYQSVLSRFHDHANVLGVTATADRGDKKSLGNYFENIAYEIPLIDLIKQKFLCPITIQSVPLKIDLSEVHSLAGDLDSGELGHVLEPYLGQIAHAIKKYAGERKTLCFLPLIATSEKFVACCQDAGITAEHIDGESPDRKEKLTAFARGDFQLLSNAMLLTEGYDCCPISCIVVLRPTRSRPLYAQMAGRGTRIADAKENLLLLDFLWMHERHALVHPASLIAGTEEESEEMTRLAEERADALPEDVGDQIPLDLVGLQSEVQSQREEALRKKLAAMADRKAKFISAEEFSVRHHVLAIAEFEPTMKWHSEAVTEKQSLWLSKAGVNVDTVSGKGQASKILDVYFTAKKFEPASPKQKWVMRYHGWVSSDGLRTSDAATSDEARQFFNKFNGKVHA